MIKAKALALLGLVFLSLQAHPAPIAYEFSGEITSGSGPFAIGSQLTASFDYDPDTPAFRTNVDGAEFGPALGNYGFFSIFLGAVSGFTGNIQGEQFATDGSAVLVGDGSGGDPLSGIFASAGPTSPGWTGLSVLGYELVGFTMFTVGLSAMLSSQDLPGQWPNFADTPGGFNTGFNMDFVDSAGVRTTQSIWGSAGGNVSIRPVNEPGVLALLLVGLLGGAMLRRRSRP